MLLKLGFIKNYSHGSDGASRLKLYGTTGNIRITATYTITQLLKFTYGSTIVPNNQGTVADLQIHGQWMLLQIQFRITRKTQVFQVQMQLYIFTY